MDDLYRREPHLGPGATGALEIPDEGIVCPFTTPLAFATEAVANGVDLRLDTRVEGVRPAPPDDGPVVGGDGSARGPVHELVTTGGVVRARWVVNAAGLYADELDRQMGHGGFSVTPRGGSWWCRTGPPFRPILLPVPTATQGGASRHFVSERPARPTPRTWSDKPTPRSPPSGCPVFGQGAGSSHLLSIGDVHLRRFSGGHRAR